MKTQPLIQQLKLQLDKMEPLRLLLPSQPHQQKQKNLLEVPQLVQKKQQLHKLQEMDQTRERLKIVVEDLNSNQQIRPPMKH